MFFVYPVINGCKRREGLQLSRSVDRHVLACIDEQVIGIVIVGDLHCHHVRWLKHSHITIVEGDMLKSICDEQSLVQVVKEPISTKGPRFMYQEPVMESTRALAALAIIKAAIIIKITWTFFVNCMSISSIVFSVSNFVGF